jgi:hypothetical protein
MAHHNNTPKSVLNAPKSTPVVLHENPYANRYERRRTRDRGERTRPGSNSPAVRYNPPPDA